MLEMETPQEYSIGASPAFPNPPEQQGMTLLDYFAGQVLNGLVSHYGFDLGEGGGSEYAWRVARAMVNTRPTDDNQDWTVVVD